MTQNLDRLGAAFDQCVESALPSVDYAAWYNCQVVSQNADGSVDLQPNVSYIPSQKNIQLLFPFPGVKITVQEGAQVLLGWSNGDPAYPVAALWAGGSPGDLQTLSIGPTRCSRQRVKRIRSRQMLRWAPGWRRSWRRSLRQPHPRPFRLVRRSLERSRVGRPW